MHCTICILSFYCSYDNVLTEDALAQALASIWITRAFGAISAIHTPVRSLQNVVESRYLITHFNDQCVHLRGILMKVPPKTSPPWYIDTSDLQTPRPSGVPAMGTRPSCKWDLMSNLDFVLVYCGYPRCHYILAPGYNVQLQHYNLRGIQIQLQHVHIFDTNSNNLPSKLRPCSDQRKRNHRFSTKHRKGIGKEVQNMGTELHERVRNTGERTIGNQHTWVPWGDY